MALGKDFCTSADRMGRLTVCAVTVNPSCWSCERIEAESDICIESNEGRGLSCGMAAGKLLGEAGWIGEVGRSGLAIPRDGDEGVAVPLGVEP